MFRFVSTRVSALAIAAALASLAGIVPAGAQTPDAGWQWTLAPYLWASSLNGTLVVKGQKADVDLSASDIWDHTDFGFMGMFVTRKGDWGFTGDFVTVDLSAESQLADVDPSLGIAAVQVVRRLSDAVDLTFGARYNRLEANIDFNPPINTQVGKTREWVHPMVGVVLKTSREHRWHASLIADFGGTGAHSDLTWQLFPSAGIKMAEWVSFEIGYRYLDTKYETGDGTDRFEYDVVYQGPVLGFAFTF